MRVTETFTSIQGEGPASGSKMFFIRLSGCNVRCPYCDTEYSFEKGEEMTVGELREMILEKGLLVAITGGEPLMQKEEVIKLIDSLPQVFFEIQSNGTIEIFKRDNVRWALDIKTPSTGIPHEKKNLSLLSGDDWVNFVICGESDLDWSFQFISSEIPENIPVYLTPSYNSFSKEKLWREIVARGDMRTHFGFQLHKCVWGDKRGV